MNHFACLFFEAILLVFNTTASVVNIFIDCFAENKESSILDDDFNKQLSGNNKSSIGGVRPDTSKPSIKNRFEL